MVAIGGQVAVLVRNGDDRIEETAERLDHSHQPLDVRLRWIALIGCRLDPIDRQRREHRGSAAEWLTVSSDHHPVVGSDPGQE